MRGRCSIGRILAAGTLTPLLVIGASHLILRFFSRRRNFSRLATLPAREVGLVPCCARLRRNGEPNPFFRSRVEAALGVWKAGKVRRFVVSGDGTSRGDAPWEMRAALAAGGIPREQIRLDQGGRNTLASVLRLLDAEPGTSWMVISQAFQNRRAIYLGICHGADPIGFEAESPAAVRAWRTTLREQLSKVKAVFEGALRRRPADLPG